MEGPSFLPSLLPSFLSYRFAVLSKNGRFVAVVETTAMSPRAEIVYMRPATNDTAVRLMRFVAAPPARVFKS